MSIKYRIIDDQVLPCYFEELDGYPKFRGGESGHEAESVYQVSSLYVDTFVKWLVGRNEWEAGSSVINVYPGHRLTGYPLGDMRCYACDIEPAEANQAAANSYFCLYNSWLVTARYKIQPSNKLLLIYDEKTTPVSEYVANATSGYYWDAAKTIPLEGNDAPGRVIRSNDIELRYKNIPIQALQFAYGSNVGKVNVAEITLKRWTASSCAAKTLLFGTPEYEYSYSQFGETQANATFFLTYRPATWDKFPRSGTSTFSFLYNSGGGQVALYDTFDMTELFPELVT